MHKNTNNVPTLQYLICNIHTLLMTLVNGIQGLLQMTSKEYISTCQAHKSQRLTEVDATNHKTT